MERTFPNVQQNQQKVKENLNFASKSCDLEEALSPKSLIQSCLTFNGCKLEEDINFLNQAMQPDKIFDLPLALVKVQ